MEDITSCVVKALVSSFVNSLVEIIPLYINNCGLECIRTHNLLCVRPYAKLQKRTATHGGPVRLASVLRRAVYYVVRKYPCVFLQEPITHWSSLSARAVRLAKSLLLITLVAWAARCRSDPKNPSPTSSKFCISI